MFERSSVVRDFHRAQPVLKVIAFFSVVCVYVNPTSTIFALSAPATCVLLAISLLSSELVKSRPKGWKAVIGAGPSGLATARELMHENHDVIIFESMDRIGGAFASAYNGATLTSSNVITAFSSFPPSERSARHWTAGEYVQYLNRYATANGISSDRIRFRTLVQRVYQTQNETWIVNSKCLVSNKVSESKFDAVVVCVGSHQHSSIPESLRRKLQTFPGKVLHSKEYKHAEQVKGKRVVVIGLGESGSDVSWQASQVASKVCISTRSGAGYSIPRKFGDMPTDLDTSRAHHLVHQGRLGWSSRLSNAWHLKAKNFVDRITEKFFLRTTNDVCEMEAQKIVSKMNNRGDLPWYRRFGTKNIGYARAVASHGAVMRPDLERFEGSKALFVDGSSFEDVDVVVRSVRALDCDTNARTQVLCTGYRIAFQFLDNDVEKKVCAIRPSLFKHCIEPSIGMGLSFVGFCRPGVGSIPPLSEMQARYLALLHSGKTDLPPQLDMIRTIQEDDLITTSQYPRDARRIGSLCDFLRLLDSLATLIGCEAPYFNLFRPIETYKVLCGPITGSQFRLRGPGAMPEIARRALWRT